MMQKIKAQQVNIPTWYDNENHTSSYKISLTISNKPKNL